ncbi:hypothetical protein [Cochlodiniinecator piscidefendens]|uniref:hypothetical protein n=1 Tax=Cochlodiniinecator piscidefendens TaxID=2715756 RepID=UPI00140A69F6|nr:hypothetical protein [Cochlodiniinecator piscidefendens]
MLFRNVAFMTGIGLLAACTSQQQDDLARRAAKSAVTPVVQEQLPGVPVGPAVDCVIDNANRNELRGLASNSITGPTASTVEIVTNIISRPQALECLAVSGLPALLA